MLHLRTGSQRLWDYAVLSVLLALQLYIYSNSRKKGLELLWRVIHSVTVHDILVQVFNKDRHKQAVSFDNSNHQSEIERLQNPNFHERNSFEAAQTVVPGW